MNDNRSFREHRTDSTASTAESATNETQMTDACPQYVTAASQERPDQTAELAARLMYATLARLELTNRRRRIGIFGATMFGEPGWEVLLTLYAGESRRQTIARISKTVTASWSSTLRWIEQLDEAGMVTREPNPTDRRSVLVAITPKGVRALDLYFSQMATVEQ